MNIPRATLETLETLAREICDARNGEGHYDKVGTHRSHWRALALQMTWGYPPVPLYKRVLRAIARWFV